MKLTSLPMMQKKVVMTVIVVKSYRDIRLMAEMVITNPTYMTDMNMTQLNRQLIISRNKVFVRECNSFAVIWVGLFGRTYD